MLFNSYIFIFAFLPVTYLVYRILDRHFRADVVLAWLVIASLFFYGWWNPKYLFLILFSMAVNFVIGRKIIDAPSKSSARLFVTLGVTLNLSLLAYYKYANFFVDTLNSVVQTDFNLQRIFLPLAISFFTFQQIAYLVDIYRGDAERYKFRHYALFVTFFPQLIAGPIVHHREMLPQFQSLKKSDRTSDMVVGLTIFCIGLFKKTVLADGIALYSTPLFDAAAGGDSLSLFNAWGAGLGYTLQLYFDFSGYSDMATGAARLFGIRLPINFDSPLKTTSIAEFWRRWHITLARFMRDYVFIPLGGSRGGSINRARNLFISMVLCGIWHGAGWTYIVFGLLHGTYLVINITWRSLLLRLGLNRLRSSLIYRYASWMLTFGCWTIGLVIFRADDLPTAMRILSGMSGGNGAEIPNGIFVRLGPLRELLQGIGVESYIGGGAAFSLLYVWIFVLAGIALLLPNVYQITARFNPVLDYEARAPNDTINPRVMPALEFKLNYRWMFATALASTVGILALTSVSEFLYFQF